MTCEDALLLFGEDLGRCIPLAGHRVRPLRIGLDRFAECGHWYIKVLVHTHQGTPPVASLTNRRKRSWLRMGSNSGYRRFRATNRLRGSCSSMSSASFVIPSITKPATVSALGSDPRSESSRSRAEL